MTLEGVPLVYLPVHGQTWLAIIDTGFNGALELPERLRPLLPHSYAGLVSSVLAGGHRLREESYRVEFPFDGETIRPHATFAPVNEILIGTRLLRDYRLEIDFPARTVRLERVR